MGAFYWWISGNVLLNHLSKQHLCGSQRHLYMKRVLVVFLKKCKCLVSCDHFSLPVPFFNLKSQSWIVVFVNIDRSAMGKSKLFQHTLHHFVVAMSIYPQMSALFQCPFDAEGTNSLLGTIRSYPVNELFKLVESLATILNMFPSCLSAKLLLNALYQCFGFL